MTPRTERLAVVMLVCAPDKRRRDLDNYCKCIFDAFTKAGVWNDDSQIDLLVVSRGFIVKPEGVVFIGIASMDDANVEEMIESALDACASRAATPEGREAGGVQSRTCRKSSADAGSAARARIQRSMRSPNG